VRLETMKLQNDANRDGEQDAYGKGWGAQFPRRRSDVKVEKRIFGNDPIRQPGTQRGSQYPL
jgi:hypothetical protein